MLKAALTDSQSQLSYLEKVQCMKPGIDNGTLSQIWLQVIETCPFPQLFNLSLKISLWLNLIKSAGINTILIVSTNSNAVAPKCSRSVYLFNRIETGFTSSKLRLNISSTTQFITILVFTIVSSSYCTAEFPAQFTRHFSCCVVPLYIGSVNRHTIEPHDTSVKPPTAIHLWS